MQKCLRTFKVLDGLDPELECCVFITHKDGARMLLEGRYCPHVIHSFLNGLVQGKGFVCTSDQDHNLDAMPSWSYKIVYNIILCYIVQAMSYCNVIAEWRKHSVNIVYSYRLCSVCRVSTRQAKWPCKIYDAMINNNNAIPPPHSAKTALIHWGLLKVCCSTWHQDTSSRCLKPCKLQVHRCLDWALENS